jgi:hypothetical protein
VSSKCYVSLSVREDVGKMLDELRAETGIQDLSDLLLMLVKLYRLCVRAYLEYLKDNPRNPLHS